MIYELELPWKGIGDQIAVTSFPENLYNITGKKTLIKDSKIWAFKHNPYVLFETSEETQKLLLLPSAREAYNTQPYIENKSTLIFSSQAELLLYFVGYNVDFVKLRHPRLYIYEDIKQEFGKLVVHSEGSDRTKVCEPAIRTGLGEDYLRIFTDDIIKTIHKNYKDWKIVQVGGKDDKDIGASIDLRGKLDYFEIAKEIASSQIFIGINSGMMNIANCYPKVHKRIILTEFSEECLGKGKIPFRPLEIRNPNMHWLDLNNSYFNRFQYDIGSTFTYKKI